jgi:hypothetical protein
MISAADVSVYHCALEHLVSGQTEHLKGPVACTFPRCGMRFPFVRKSATYPLLRRCLSVLFTGRTLMSRTEVDNTSVISSGSSNCHSLWGDHLNPYCLEMTCSSCCTCRALAFLPVSECRSKTLKSASSNVASPTSKIRMLLPNSMATKSADMLNKIAMLPVQVDQGLNPYDCSLLLFARYLISCSNATKTS